jgi:hypothetical protein
MRRFVATSEAPADRNPTDVGPGPTSRRQTEARLLLLLRRRRRFCRSLLTGAIGGILLLRFGAPARAASREYQLKAAFLYNFVQFVSWPDRTFADAKSPIVLATLGAADPFDGALEAAVAGKTVGGRPLVVKHFATAADVGKCQLLFVPAGGTDQLAAALRNAGPAGVLTVGEADAFLKDGGIIRFYQEDNRLRFEISQAAATKAGIQVSAKLMRLAKPHEG